MRSETCLFPINWNQSETRVKWLFLSDLRLKHLAILADPAVWTFWTEEL